MQTITYLILGQAKLLLEQSIDRDLHSSAVWVPDPIQNVAEIFPKEILEFGSFSAMKS